MRVVIVVPVFPQLSETFVVQHVAGLAGLGVDVHVVAAERGRGEIGLDNHRVHVLGHRRSAVAAHGALALLRLATSGSVPRRVGAERLRFARTLVINAPILALRPDVVHFEFGGVARGRMALARHAAVVVSFRGADLNFSGIDDNGHYDEVWHSAHGFHFLGRDLLARAATRGFVPGGAPYRLIPPSVDVRRFPPPARRPEAAGSLLRPLRLLSVGRLEWKKGYELAIEAVHRLRAAGLHVEYRIVGDGAHRTALEFTRRDAGVADAVTLLGALPHDRVADELAWADVFVHAAVSEGFCNAVMEAQAMQLPVVCTDADGLAENVVDGQTGVVVPRRDPQALADAISALAADATRRCRMGTKGRRRVIEEFDPTRQIEAFVELYEAAIGHRRRRMRDEQGVSAVETPA